MYNKLSTLAMAIGLLEQIKYWEVNTKKSNEH